MKNVRIAEVLPEQVIIEISGRIDSNNAEEVNKTIDEIISAYPNTKQTYDVKNLEYISSAGLRVLLSLQKKSVSKIKVINVNNDIYEIFSMTGFDRILDLRKELKIIRIEGAEKIGQGANGEIFRIDEDTIYKVYQPGTPLDDVERERELAKQAFLKGIPTAISYDIVIVEGGRYAIGFELLKAESLSKMISEHLDQFDIFADEYVQLYKMFHQSTVEQDEFPSAKDIYRGYINECIDWYTTEELDLLRCLVDSIPDRKTLIHGDYHARNIMVMNGELFTIDMGDISYGHPIFDFLATAATQANLVDINPEFAQIHTGMPVECIKKLWNALLHLYFEDKTEEEIKEIDKQIRMFSKLKVAFAPVIARGIPIDLINASVNDAKNNLIPYINEMIGSIDW